MEQKHTDQPQIILTLCRAASDVVDNLVPPVGASRETYFSDENLWRLEIDTVCSLVHEYYSGVLVCLQQHLDFPAAALTRSIHEVCFRFKYLAENERELRDWEEWQLTQDYHMLRTFLEHDLEFLNPNGDKEFVHTLHGNMAALDDLLGGPPPPRRHPWRTTGQIFDNLADVGTLPNERARGFRRHTIGFFSEYTHPRRFPAPPEGLILLSAGFSVLITLRRVMELCRKKKLLPPEVEERASQIMEECERLLRDAN